jgi:hypothetical protein
MKFRKVHPFVLGYLDDEALEIVILPFIESPFVGLDPSDRHGLLEYVLRIIHRT